jgi:cell division protein FtsQ
MNRRRSPAAGRKKTSKRKPLAPKPPAEKKAAPKRRARKNGPAKKAPAKAATRRALTPKKPKPKTTGRRKASEKRVQNRRRPQPKKPREQTERKSWRERVGALRANLVGWVMGHRLHVRRAGKAALAGIALAAVLWVADRTYAYAHSAEAFAIAEVDVLGNRQLEPIEVRRAAHLQIGSNIFEVSMEEARNHLLQHPWVEDATVVRKLPGRVRIEVVERTPVALVALDQLYLVSDEGAVFKRLGVDDPADLPVITGIASERFYDDLDYRTEVLLGSMALLHDYEGAGLAAREPVSEIHFDGASGIELFVGADGMNVRLGNGQHRQKLRRFRTVLERLEREKTRPSYVYLDNVRSPERVTVRLP